MIKEYLTVIRNLSYQDLENNINRELLLDPLSIPRLLVLSTVLVDRVSRTFKNLGDDKEYLKLDSVMACLAYLIRNRGNTLSLDKINQIIRKELNIACNYMPTPNIDYCEDPFFSFGEDSSMDPARQFLKNKILDFVLGPVPLRLKPIIYFYMDTGLLFDDLLSDVDKAIVRKSLHSIGNWDMIDTDELLKDMPSTVKGKSTFLAMLAQNHPEVFIIMTLLGDVNKLSIITEILGGKSIKIPSTESLVQIISDVTRAASDSESGNKTTVSDKYLKSLADELNTKPETIPNTLLEYVDKFMNLEYANYISSLDTISKKISLNSNEAGRYFGHMNNEFKASVNLLERLKQLT
jgi:hypothetical protein